MSPTPYLARWDLVPDGAPIVTPGSRLLPVRQGATPAMLKIALADEERAGARLMAWWDGDGAARVLAQDDDAILLERAQGSQSLAALARGGQDDAACRILCQAAARLHGPRARPLPDLVPLAWWFRGLAPAAAQHGGILARAAAAADALLAAPQDVVVLHGDIHHGNVLDFGPRGWLAIDPKGLQGERGFDYANLFCNPDARTALAPGRFRRRVAVVATAAGLDRERLLRWILAWAGLSSAWLMADGEDPAMRLEVATLAAAELATRG
ncbi:aminoglycoside phosphotransferase family protein [Vineibacter terrae]|uniref:aminoglycoside phosphotransferase family protein n=1 Tax=Vineibacter terrae TaxID=2586908 RepID=UPI002E361D36|nr:aminoglycoside phosphotransferase family protein [Vineibacter terrae]HEX2891847.1 aminoglycoside phosphotransferase family protein [Vineibacter terrae]